MDRKTAISKIIKELPLSMQEQAIRSYERYKESKREKLSHAVVERLYFQVLNEARNRGK